MLTDLPTDSKPCQRNNTVHQFVDLEARVADEEEEEGGNYNNMVHSAFPVIIGMYSCSQMCIRRPAVH